MTASSRFLLTFCCALLLVHFGSAIASAHEVRPAYLELTERGPFVFDMLLKTPMRGDARLALGATLTGRTGLLQPVSSHASDDAMVQTWRIGLIGGSIAGRELRIEGLERTMTDALVRIEFTDGTTWTDRLTPDRPSVRVPLRPTGWEVAQTYLLLGIEHILLGTDHLLFVLGLILIAPSLGKLIQAITAFTAAHSITLAGATLGLVHVPSKPVEAVIALSIAFLAMEIVRARGGKAGLAANAPWVAAFGFGLLHGFGFAGALKEVGLPVGNIPVALLFFNAGVEAGKLAFVAMVLGLAALLCLESWRLPSWVRVAPTYAIGSIAMFWVIERIAAF
jgi:hydrogenase/urease accessory protein HupE